MDSESNEIIIKDHALVRWIERVQGVSLEPLRNAIRKEISGASRIGATRLSRNGYDYILQEGTGALLTVMPSSFKGASSMKNGKHIQRRRENK